MKNGNAEKLLFLLSFSLFMKSGNFKLSSVFGLTVLSVVALVAVSLFSVEVFSSFGEALSEKSVAMIVARTLSPKLSLITVPKIIFTSG